MAILEIARGQHVTIPAIRLTSGREFSGTVRASDGETLVIELDAPVHGQLPVSIDELVMLTWQSDGLQRTCPFLVRSHTPRAVAGQVVIQERREAPRIRIDMDLSYELIPNSRLKDVIERVMAHVNPLGEPEPEVSKLMRGVGDPISDLRQEVAALRDMLSIVMWKLENLTALVSAGGQASTSQIYRPLSLQNCSSSGLGMFTLEGLPEGQYLHLHMTLRTMPQTLIDCVGVVVRSVKLEPGEAEVLEGPRYDIGVRFTHLHESDRERLIHYIFKAQRQLLRDLKEAREALLEQGGRG